MRPSRPARAIWFSTSGSHQMWNVSTVAPTTAGSKSAAMSSAWPSVETTARSDAYIGCSGSIASVTPAAAASGASSPIASRTRSRAPIRSREPSGSPPATSTRIAVDPGAPAAARIAASSIATRLSSSAARRREPSGSVKNPPRQCVVKRRPESVSSFAAVARPTSCTGSRHRPIACTPASAVTRRAVARSAYLIVAWLIESRGHRSLSLSKVMRRLHSGAASRATAARRAPAARGRSRRSRARRSATGAEGSAPSAGRRPSGTPTGGR